MRIALTLPRSFDRELVRGAGITGNEYMTLLYLSEASDRQLRMTDLAQATALSASRMTHLVDDLQFRGFVAKRASTTDGRGNLAILTSAGVAKLEIARDVHLSSLRAYVFSRLDPATLRSAMAVVSSVAAEIERR